MVAGFSFYSGDYNVLRIMSCLCFSFVVVVLPRSLIINTRSVWEELYTLVFV